MSIADKLQTIAENEQKVFEAGKDAENRRYWEKFWSGNMNSNTGNYILTYAFCGGGWNAETFSKIIYPPENIKVVGSTGGRNVFTRFNRNYNYNTPPIDLSEFCRKVDFSTMTSAYEIFYNARAVNIIIDLGCCTDITRAFSCDNGGTIDNITLKITSICTVLTNAFTNNVDLKDIRFTEDSEIINSVSFAQSYRLTDESIQSIINALGTVTTSKKITFHSEVVDRLTDEQLTQISSKGWNIA